MTKLQDDLLQIYNALVVFSKSTLNDVIPTPIVVTYREEHNALVFKQKGKEVMLQVLNYYCGYLKNIKKTYLLPKDYDILMGNLSDIIGSGKLLEDRVLVSPEPYGFEIYMTDSRTTEFKKGPTLLSTCRFVTDNSWFFRMITKFRYKSIL